VSVIVTVHFFFDLLLFLFAFTNLFFGEVLVSQLAYYVQVANVVELTLIAVYFFDLVTFAKPTGLEKKLIS